MKYPREIKVEEWGKVIHFACPKSNSDLYFEICSIEDLYSDAADINAAITSHRHDFYQLIICLEGDGFHVLDFEKDQIQGGRVFFCAPEQCHRIEGASRISKGFSIMFNDAFLSELAPDVVHEIKYKFFRRYGRVLYMDFSLLEAGQLLEIIHLMQREQDYNSEAYKHFSYSLHLLVLFFIKLKRLNLSEQDDLTDYSAEEGRLICQFIDFIEIHFKEKWSVCDYSRELNCSESKLNRICQKIVHVSPLQIVNKRRIDEAKRMLSFSRMPVKEIAFELGFPSQPYFVTFFKKNLGMCPSEFRDLMNICPNEN